MALLLSFGGTMSVSATAFPFGTLEVTDDSAVIVLDLDIRAAAAFASRFQRLGVRVDYDRGDGVMVTLPDHEVGNALTIDESTETYGDRLSLRLVGERWSPFARKILQAKTEIHVYFVTGSPQNEFATRVFTSHVVTARYDVQPPSAEITCLDAAALYAEKRAKDWSLEPNSGRTRLSINLELLALGEIPIRSIDIGPDGGGVVNKPHTLGDRPILDFLRDFDAVLGAEIGFESGGFVARRYDATAASVLELNPSNLLPQLSLDAPDPLDPNVLGVVSVSSTRTEIGGYTTEGPTSVVVVGPYAPDTAEQLQDAGVITPTGLTPVESVQIISESLTTITKYGGVAVRTEKVERGWFAESAAGAQVERVGSSPSSPGVWEYTVDPVAGKVYIFPDGSTRAIIRETFRDLARTIITKGLDDSNRVVTEREERYFWRRFRKALFTVDLLSSVLVDEPPQDPVPIGDDGMGMQFATDVFGKFGPDELIEKVWTLNDDGAIESESETVRYHDLPAKKLRSDGAKGFGLDSRTYHVSHSNGEGNSAFWPNPDAFRGLRVTTKTYRVIDEDSYEIIESVREGSRPPTVTTSGAIIGSLPRPEQAEPSQSSQEIRAIYEDLERIGLAGEEIEDIEHNEFIETQAEAEAYARHRARMASAITLECTMPIEGLLHKFRCVTVNIPGASIDGLRFAIRSVRRDAASFSQPVTAEHYSDGI